MEKIRNAEDVSTTQLQDRAPLHSLHYYFPSCRAPSHFIGWFRYKRSILFNSHSCSSRIVQNASFCRSRTFTLAVFKSETLVKTSRRRQPKRDSTPQPRPNEKGQQERGGGTPANANRQQGAANNPKHEPKHPQRPAGAKPHASRAELPRVVRLPADGVTIAFDFGSSLSRSHASRAELPRVVRLPADGVTILRVSTRTFPRSIVRPLQSGPAIYNVRTGRCSSLLLSRLLFQGR